MKCRLWLTAALLAGCFAFFPGCSQGQGLEQESQLEPENQEDQVQTVPAKEETSVPKAGEQNTRKEKESFRIAGYLPAANLAAAGEEYDVNLTALSDGILNTAAYWNENGEIDLTDAFAPAMERWNSLNLPEQKRWCTVNPAGRLIREGTAGASIGTKEKREVLIGNLSAFCEDNGFDGIDIDWEFPAEGEWEAFSSLIIELKPVLAEKGKQLSLAFYPGMCQLSPEAVQAVDAVNIMAYDQFDENGYHSTFETAVQSVEAFLDVGFQTNQLRLGIPFYGRPTDRSAKWPYYNETSGMEENQVLYNGSYFNGISLVRQKTAYAAQKGLSGVMLYHIYCDFPADQSQSLTSAVAEAACSFVDVPGEGAVP